MTLSIAAKPREWRGTWFDSQLEADWAKSLMTWGIAYTHHPGRVYGYEPDFLLHGDPGMETSDVFLEVKGAHNDRFEKPLALARERGASVVIGRVGLVPSGSNAEIAGAVWHNVVPGGHEWFVYHTGISAHFVDSVWLTERETGAVRTGAVFVSAERVGYHPMLEGLPMGKVT